MSKHGFWCADCGADDAMVYVVTILDPSDVKTTRTEVCMSCYAAEAGFDVESSVSRQHYIDTGRYLTPEEVATA